MKTILLFSTLILSTASLAGTEARQLVQTFINNPNDPALAAWQIKSGTRYVLQTFALWDQLTKQEQQLYLQRIMEPPLRQRSMVSPSGKFSLYWDEDGLNAVPLADPGGNGVPDYIDSAMVIFDRVWQIEIDTLGFQPPPDDNGIPVTTYPIYFTDMIYYGLTYPSMIDIPSLPGTNYTSYIEIENDFMGFPSEGLAGLKVTAAHEFNHAMQFGYNVRTEDFYFYEMTSTWMEDIVYPTINDYYQYLNPFFEIFSNTSFNFYNSYSVFPYANCLYLKMLAKQYGPQIVTLIWDRIKTENSLTAIARAISLPPYHTSWLASLNQYAVWLYFTGSRTISDQYFIESADFPELIIKYGDQISVDSTFIRTFSISDLANRVLLLDSLNNHSILYDIEVRDYPEAGFLTIRNQQESQLNLVNHLYFEPISAADSLILILTNAGLQDTSFSVQVYLDSIPPDSQGLKNITFGPNPVNIAAGQRWIDFRNLPPQSELYIFTINGRSVVHIGNISDSNLRWNLTNARGETVATGIYLFRIKGRKFSMSGKIAIIR